MLIFWPQPCNRRPEHPSRRNCTTCKGPVLVIDSTITNDLIAAIRCIFTFLYSVSSSISVLASSPSARESFSVDCRLGYRKVILKLIFKYSSYFTRSFSNRDDEKFHWNIWIFSVLCLYSIVALKF